MHIGNHIKQILDEQPKDHTVTWFARQLNQNRRNVYNIFSRATIDTELLARICRILDHDFFADMSGEFRADRDVK